MKKPRRHKPNGARPALKPKKRPAATAPAPIWLGARRPGPFRVQGLVDAPIVELWVRDSDGHLVCTEVHERPSRGAGRELRQALASHNGPRPRLVVEDDEWAQALAHDLPLIHIAVRALPELDDVFASLGEWLARAQAPTSYLADDGIIAPVIARFFSAARALHELAPWRILHDDELFGLTIPALDVHDAVAVIIGALGESEGVLIFPSADDHARMLAGAEDVSAGRIEAGELMIDFSMIALNFAHRRDLPRQMVEEVRRHRWPVAGPAAYPVIDCHLDGLPVSATAREFEIATAFAETFVKASRAGVIDDEDDVEFGHITAAGFDVRLETGIAGKIAGAFDPDDMSVGANAGDIDVDDMSVDALGLHMSAIVADYAAGRWGKQFIDRVTRLVHDADELPVVIGFALYDLAAEEGASAGRHVLGSSGFPLQSRERAMLEAELAGWMSLWKVTAITPGESVALADLLTGEQRIVHDQLLAGSVMPNLALLARVIGFEGRHYLSGAATKAVSPMISAKLTERMRKYFKADTVSPARLREANAARYLLRQWRSPTGAGANATPQVPQLRNTDGDVLLFTVDRYTLDMRDRPVIRARLAALEDVDQPEEDRFVLLRGRTVVGRIRLTDATLHLETNSIARADAVRTRVQAACGALIEHVARTYEDANATLARRRSKKDRPARTPSPEQLDLVREFKREHYEHWLDESIPALGGKTPREAVRSPTGRKDVAGLIDYIEATEARLPERERFDVAFLRTVLGID